MELYSSSELAGTPLDAIEPFTEELAGIMVEMQEKLASETKLLEGSEIPEREEIIIPRKNELSDEDAKEDQWMSVSLNGSSTTDPTHTLILESSSSACIADLFVQDCPIRQSSVRCTDMLIESCEGTSEGCGCVTGAMNAPFVCTEQTINVPTVGTLNEEK
jgi:hypothetical protein